MMVSNEKQQTLMYNVNAIGLRGIEKKVWKLYSAICQSSYQPIYSIVCLNHLRYFKVYCKQITSILTQIYEVALV